MTGERNPYVGPAHFSEAEGELFFGREHEARQVLSLTMASRSLMLYSPSGAGKTSLVNARLVPMLKKQRAHVRGVVRLGGRPPTGFDLGDGTNIFVLNSLLSLRGNADWPDGENLAGTSLHRFLAEHPQPPAPKGFDPLHVIIFDQFEEIFTSFPGRWRDHDGFFADLGAALEADPLLRAVFVIREEYIAGLDPLAGMLPGGLRRRFRLERLRKSQAQLAIEGPLQGTGRSFKPGVAEKLVENLLTVPIRSLDGTVVDESGEFVEPVQLQVVCKRLWDALPPEVKEIDEKWVEKCGDVDEALTEYYEETLKYVVASRPVMDEGKLRKWFDEDLITSIGTRGTVFMDEKGEAGGLSREAVALLEERRLIRLEPRGGAAWYELTHDRFINPIRESNLRWREALGMGEVYGRELQERADEWAAHNRPAAGLLSADELRAAQQWERSETAGLLGVSTTLREYIRASETALFKKKAGALRRQNAIIVFIAVVTLAMLLVIGYLLMRAHEDRARAEKADQVARGALARDYAQVSGKEYDALVLGLEAVKLSAPGEAPPGAEQGLREALAGIGNSLLLRECRVRPDWLDLSSDGRLALAVCNDWIHVWNAATGDHLYSKPDDPNDAGGGRPPGGWKQVGFSPDGKLVVAISRLPPREAGLRRDADSAPEDVRKRTVLVFDAQTGQPSGFQAQLKDVKGMRMSDDGARVLADDEAGNVLVVKRDGSAVKFFTPEQAKSLSHVELSPDGRRLVAVRRGDSRGEVWDTERPEAFLFDFDMGTIEGEGAPDVIGFSSDSRRGVLVRSGARGGASVVVWDESGGHPAVTSFKSRLDSAQHAAFTPDNNLVIVGDKATRLHNPKGEVIGERAVPPGPVQQFDATHLLLIRDEGGAKTLVRWDASTGDEEVLDVKGKIEQAVVSLGEARGLTTNADGVTQVWDLRESPDVSSLTLPELRRRACAKLSAQNEYRQVETYCRGPR